MIKLGYNAVPAGALKLLAAVFKSGQFSPGPKVKEFEDKFAALHQAKHAVFVNSGTDALRLSLLALKEKHGWKDGDRVAVPALTFVATVNVILQAGLRPVFLDVSRDDYCLNEGLWQDFLLRGGEDRDRLRCVMPVHLFGQACRSGIFSSARSNGIRVLEDSCETVLNAVQGDVSCHSTYMAHHITTGVGGLALTNSDALNNLIRSFANHGRNTAYLPGYKSLGLGKDLLKKRFRFDRVGYSSRATEFDAALGLSQLAGLKKNVEKRQLTASFLKNALKGFPELALAHWDINRDHTYMMYPIVLRDNSGIDKYDLCLHLERSGIETRDMMPVTNQPCYRDLVSEADFPVARNINKNGFYIPVNPGMTDKDIKRIRRAFESYLLTKK